MIKNHQEFINAIHEVEAKYGTVTNPKADKDELMAEIRMYADHMPGKHVFEMNRRSKYVYTVTFKDGEVFKTTTIKNLVEKTKEKSCSISMSYIRYRLRINHNKSYFKKVGTIERELGE